MEVAQFVQVLRPCFGIETHGALGDSRSRRSGWCWSREAKTCAGLWLVSGDFPLDFFRVGSENMGMYI